MIAFNCCPVDIENISFIGRAQGVVNLINMNMNLFRFLKYDSVSGNFNCRDFHVLWTDTHEVILIGLDSLHPMDMEIVMQLLDKLNCDITIYSMNPLVYSRAKQLNWDVKHSITIDGKPLEDFEEFMPISIRPWS